MKKKCPHCGSSKTAPILYGYPILNEETKQALDEKKLYLGGCCVCGIEPEFHCFDCKKDFGTNRTVEGSTAGRRFGVSAGRKWESFNNVIADACYSEE